MDAEMEDMQNLQIAWTQSVALQTQQLTSAFLFAIGQQYQIPDGHRLRKHI